MAVLSEVFQLVPLEGALFSNAEFSAPWCVTTLQSSVITTYLSIGWGA